MVFNSMIFPLFLVATLTFHWALKDKAKRNLLLLFSSYVFYAWWDYRFLSLIILSSLVDYISGVGLGKYDKRTHRRLLLFSSLTFNLSVLATFKYFNFFSQSTASFLHMLGFVADWPTLNIILPVGISFYTFQTLSYTIDVYRGKIKACHDPLAFFLFVAFFPQLVAGPIEKAKDLLPQLQAKRVFSYKQAVIGMRYIVLGFLLKSVLADNLAPIVDSVYAAPEQFSALSLLLGTYFFAFQIYGDFAGYSYIAIGAAALFGVNLTTNFRSPYLARSMQEFWKRWHISLSSWFREYFYISLLGGNRVGKRRQTINVLATFLVSGLWHGANWTFILWGALNGLMYKYVKPLHSGSRLSDFANWFVTFNLICLTWVFFRTAWIGDGLTILGRMIQLEHGKAILSGKTWLYVLPVAATVSIEYAQRNRETIVDLGHLTKHLRVLVYLVSLLVLFFVSSVNRQPFVYFQF